MNATEIQEEIERLEKEETSYSNCVKLAVLYTVLNNYRDQQPTSSYGSSEFLLVCSQQPIDKVLDVIDEHMEAIKLLYPKEYNLIIKKIKE